MGTLGGSQLPHMGRLLFEESRRRELSRQSTVITTGPLMCACVSSFVASRATTRSRRLWYNDSEVEDSRYIDQSLSYGRESAQTQRNLACGGLRFEMDTCVPSCCPYIADIADQRASFEETGPWCTYMQQSPREAMHRVMKSRAGLEQSESRCAEWRPPLSCAVLSPKYIINIAPSLA